MRGGSISRWASDACRWCWLGIGLLIAAPTVVHAGALFETRLAVSTRGLEFRGGAIHKTIPMSELRVDLARVVDLDREPGLQPAFKLYGVGLPRYRSGWYLLRNREKALLALTPNRLAVSIPTTRGYAVLVSPDRTDEFLNALRAPTHAGRVFSVEKGR